MGRAHEPHRIDAQALHKLGGLFTLLLILVLCVMYVLWQHVHPWTLSAPPQVVPPPPRVQAAPPEDRITQYRLQAQSLNAYGWNDPAHRTAHVPIERAMALLAQQQAASSAHAGGSTAR